MTNLPVPRGRIYQDEEIRLFEESRNGVILAEFTIHQASNWLSPSASLTPEVFCEAQRVTINQLYRCAGMFRDGPVSISGVAHQPPEHHLVRPLVSEMCTYIAGAWCNKSAIHLAAYLMCRTNWIHPFFGGNGRTARAIAYIILSAKLGFVLPGEKTIPQLIDEEYRDPYYDGLKAADVAFQNGVADVSELENLVESVLADQLLRTHRMAMGKPPAANSPKSI